MLAIVKLWPLVYILLALGSFNVNASEAFTVNFKLCLDGDMSCPEREIICDAQHRVLDGQGNTFQLMPHTRTNAVHFSKHTRASLEEYVLASDDRTILATRSIFTCSGVIVANLAHKFLLLGHFTSMTNRTQLVEKIKQEFSLNESPHSKLSAESLILLQLSGFKIPAENYETICAFGKAFPGVQMYILGFSETTTDHLVVRAENDFTSIRINHYQSQYTGTSKNIVNNFEFIFDHSHALELNLDPRYFAESLSKIDPLFK